MVWSRGWALVCIKHEWGIDGGERELGGIGWELVGEGRVGGELEELGGVGGSWEHGGVGWS